MEEALRAAAGRLRRVALVEGALTPRLARIMELAERAGVPLERRPKGDLDRLAPGGRHQGVVAWGEQARTVDLETLLGAQPAPSLLVALDQVTDPGNLGAAMRSAAGFGADGVILPERGSAEMGETVRRRSAGATEHLRVARVVNLARALRQVKEAGIWVVGLEPAAPPLWEAFDLTQRVAVVLGGEGRGLRRLTREACDVRAGIPMGAAIGSLNVAVACGVALYEVIRQRRLKPVAGGS